MQLTYKICAQFKRRCSSSFFNFEKVFTTHQETNRIRLSWWNTRDISPSFSILFTFEESCFNSRLKSETVQNENELDRFNTCKKLS